MQFAAAAVMAVGSIAAGRAQKAAYNAQAAQAKIRGKMQAIKYKQQAADTMARLNQTLASTVARAAVGQDPTSGSALSLQNYALREGASEIGTSKDNAILSVENANYQADIYRRAGNAAMTSAYINAAGSLAGGVAKQNQVGWPSLSMGPSSGQFAGAPAGFAPF